MKDFLRYFISCFSAMVLDYVLTAGAIHLGLVYYAALCLGTVTGGALGYLFLVFWVFPTEKGRFSLRRIVGYSAGVGLVYAVRTFVMWIWYGLHLPESWVYGGLVLAFGCSFLCNFLYQKYLVFRRPKPEAA